MLKKEKMLKYCVFLWRLMEFQGRETLIFLCFILPNEFNLKIISIENLKNFSTFIFDNDDLVETRESSETMFFNKFSI